MPLIQGDDVPEHRPDECAEDHGGSHQVFVDQTLADGVRDFVQLRPSQRQEVSGEVEEGGEGDRPDRLQQPRSHHGRDRVGRVVQSVQKVERERDDDQADQQRECELMH